MKALINEKDLNMRVREKRNMSICKTIYIGRKEIQLERREIMKIKKDL